MKIKLALWNPLVLQRRKRGRLWLFEAFIVIIVVSIVVFPNEILARAIEIQNRNWNDSNRKTSGVPVTVSKSVFVRRNIRNFYEYHQEP